PTPQCPGPAVSGPCGANTGAGPGVDDLGPPVGARRRLQVDARHGLCDGQMPQRLRAQSGCACRLTGPAWDPPPLSSLAPLDSAASWNAPQDSGVLRCALAMAWPSALAPCPTVRGGHG